MMTTNSLTDPVKPLVVGPAKTGVLLDAGLDTVYDLIKSGELESYLEGRRRKITMQSIERLIQKRLAAASTEFEYRERMRVLRAKPRIESRCRSSKLGTK
jgi:excisionase family DNA binding protein